MDKTIAINPLYYSKKELVLAYTGGLMGVRTAYRWFNTELAKNPELTARLNALGYDTHQRLLTRAQLIAIFEAIGAP